MKRIELNQARMEEGPSPGELRSLRLPSLKGGELLLLEKGNQSLGAWLLLWIAFKENKNLNSGLEKR